MMEEKGVTRTKAGRRVTLAAIAQEAGVSVGLVSSLLSGRNYGDGGGSGIRIGAGTSERILETCRQMGYVPDRVTTYRMIYPEKAPIGLAGIQQERFQSNRYHSLILDGVVARTTAFSLNLNVLQYDADLDYHGHPEALPEWAASGDIHRLVFAGPPNLSLLEILVERGADLVYASRDPEVEGVSSVVPDYRSAAMMALQYLHSLGHRRIGLFGLPYFHESYQARELLGGARQALADLRIEERLHLDRLGSPQAGRSADLAVEAFTQHTYPVTAVFAFDDLSAESLVAAATRRGIHIPDDLSIVGCNDERQSALLNPPLTTVHLPVTEIGGRCVDRLNEIATDRSCQSATREVLPVHLVERASTRYVQHTRQR